MDAAMVSTRRIKSAGILIVNRSAFSLLAIGLQGISM